MKRRKSDMRGKNLLLLVVSLVVILTVVSVLSSSWYWLAVGAALIAVFSFLKFGHVKEGTAKAVMRFGAAREIVFVWKGYHLDDNGDIMPGRTQWPLGEFFGGLFVMVRWIDQVHKYKFRRSGVKLAEDGKIQMEAKKEEELDYALIRPDTYPTIVKGAETLAVATEQQGAAERFPVDAVFLVTIRVKNPEKALFKAPPNWLENTLARLNTLFVRWIGTKTLDQLIGLKGVSASDRKSVLWEELEPEALVEFLEKEWGLEILQGGIDLGEITPPPEIQAAAAAEKQQELQARAEVAKTMGRLVKMMAAQLGISEQDLTKEIHKTPTLLTTKYGAVYATCRDILHQQLAIEGRAFLDARFQGGHGLEELVTLFKLLPLSGNQPRGGGTAQQAGSRQRGRGQSSKTTDEASKKLQEFGAGMRDRRSSGWRSQSQQEEEEE